MMKAVIFHSVHKWWVLAKLVTIIFMHTYIYTYMNGSYIFYFVVRIICG